MNLLIEYDRMLFTWINRGWTSPVLDRLMPLVSYVSDPAVMLIWIPVVAFVLNRRMFVNADTEGPRAGRSKQSYLTWCLYTAFIYGVNAGIYETIKFIAGRPRPFVVQVAIIRIPQRTFSVMPHFTSFPSGHTVNAFMLAVLFSAVFKKWSPAFYLAAFVVALSRIYNGVHYPLDVASGACLGILITGLMLRAARSRAGLPRIVK